MARRQSSVNAEKRMEEWIKRLLDSDSDSDSTDDSAPSEPPQPPKQDKKWILDSKRCEFQGLADRSNTWLVASSPYWFRIINKDGRAVTINDWSYYIELLFYDSRGRYVVTKSFLKTGWDTNDRSNIFRAITEHFTTSPLITQAQCLRENCCQQRGAQWYLEGDKFKALAEFASANNIKIVKTSRYLFTQVT